MSSTDLEIINLKRQIEIQNAILRDIAEEMRRFNDNYEAVNKNKLLYKKAKVV